MVNGKILGDASLFNDQAIFDYAERLKYGKFHIKIDKATGLRAIIAIHSTQRGPALGGCRLIKYPTIGAAFNDAIRLGQGMTYKAAINNLPLGGGKAVLLKPKRIHDRKAYFASFGKFVDSLNGQYITALDSGTSMADMDIVATKTQYVTGRMSQGGDPSPHTALGIRLGIEAAVKFKLNKNHLKGVRVAVQGVGHVGYVLCKELLSLGAIVIACDANKKRIEKCAKELNIETVSAENIYDVDCDVFAPCALGGILNEITIPRLTAPIVAGAANNQLQKPEHGEMLHLRGILYAPDYAINAGGLIFAYAAYARASLSGAEEDIGKIYQTMMTIFERAKVENCPTSVIADKIAEEQLKQVG